MEEGVETVFIKFKYLIFICIIESLVDFEIYLTFHINKYKTFSCNAKMT